MAFCGNCGNEVKDGVKFCPECGAAIRSAAKVNTEDTQPKETASVVPESAVMTSSTDSKGNRILAWIDRYGMFVGIVLLILAIVAFIAEIPLIKILLGLVIVAAAIICLARKYRLKGFPIAALVIAAIALFVGVHNVKSDSLLGRDWKRKHNERVATQEEPTPELPTPDELTPPSPDEITPPEPSVDEVAPVEKETPKEEAPAPEEEKKEESAPEEEAAEDEAAEEEEEPAKKSDGVDPDLKAFLDSYEAFVDEYVVFMKKYQKDPTNALSMLGEYSKIMDKYADFAEKIDKYDTKTMSPADAKYYLEVTSRCTQKMMGVL